MTADPPALRITDVSKAYPTRGPALAPTSLEVRRGEFVSFVGPSGCGKSTLLAMIAGLLAPDAGQVEAAGRRVSGPGRERAIVFQDAALFPWLTVRHNVEYGLRAQGVPRRERRARVDEALAMVHLDHVGDRHPYELSGGMRQRAAIARALVLRPEILLMDEPFAALDVQTRQLMENELLELWSADRKSVVFITHDLEEAIALADRVVVLAAGPETRPIGEFVIDLPRPRDVAEIRLTPQFLALHTQIWHVMKEEVLKGYARQQRQ